MFTASRIVFNAAREGFLPESLSGLHKESKTPIAATGTLVGDSTPYFNFSDLWHVQFLVGSASLLLGGISELIECVGASIFLFYLLVIIGLLIMRFTHVDEPRLFKVSYVVAK